MNYQFGELETNRLFIRMLEEEDACDVFAYIRLAKVCKYLTIAPHQHIDETLNYLRTSLLPHDQQGVPPVLAVCDRFTDKVIGHMQIHTLEDGIGEAAFMLHPAYWHNGMMNEALQVFIKTVFYEWNIRKITAIYIIENERCQRFLESLGFQKEDVLHHYACLYDGRYHDAIVMGLLKNEGKGDDVHEKDIK